MHYTLLTFFIFKLQTTVAQYPSHTDLQKVGEVIFNNEKYNVLKPTVHVITDYFKDFMLRRDNDKFPTKRVFIDHNGFRHAWSGFGNKVQSLRKTDLKNVVLNSENFMDNLSTEKATSNDTATEVAETTSEASQTTTEVAETTSEVAETTSEVAETTTEANDTTTDAIETNIETINTSTKIPVAITEAVKTSTESTETTTDTNMSTTEIIETTAKTSDNIASKETLKNLSHEDNATESEGSEEESTESVTQVPNSAETTTFRVLFRASIQSNTSITVTTNQKVQGRQGNDKKNETNATPTKEKAVATPTKEKTVATTTFFCPFLGIITMSAFID